MEDGTRIHETLLALRRVWEAQPGLSFAQITSGLEMQGMGLNSTDSEVRELLEAQLATHPLRLEDISCRPVLVDLDSSYATIGTGWVALWGQLRPVVFPVDEVVECTVGRPLRVRDSHVHSLGRVTRLSALPPTNDDATLLLVLPDSGSHAATALLRFSARRLTAVQLWEVGRREVHERRIRVTPAAAPGLEHWSSAVMPEPRYGEENVVTEVASSPAPVLVRGTRGEEIEIPTPQACYRLT